MLHWTGADGAPASLRVQQGDGGVLQTLDGQAVGQMQGGRPTFDPQALAALVAAAPPPQAAPDPTLLGAAAPAPSSLASAPVNLGPLKLAGATSPGPAAIASMDGTSTAQVQTGSTAAMTILNPAWAGALDRPGPAAPPLALPPEGFDIHPDAGTPLVVSTPLPDAALVPNHTGSPPVTINPGDLQEYFPALQPQGPTIFAMRPGAQAASQGYPGVGETLQGGPTFAETPYLYPVQPGQSNVVTIPLTGSRRGDFAAANKAAGLTDVVPAGRDAPEGYTWHHVDNYNTISGKSTLELVDSEAHRATIPHSGSVAHYEAVNKTTYKR